MTNDTNTEAVEEVTDTVEATDVPASLTVQDLASLRNIIDVASKRGAFKPEEFSAVGDTYNKLTNFIQAITPPAEPAPVDAEVPADAEVVDAEATDTAGE